MFRALVSQIPGVLFKELKKQIQTAIKKNEGIYLEVKAQGRNTAREPWDQGRVPKSIDNFWGLPFLDPGRGQGMG